MYQRLAPEDRPLHDAQRGDHGDVDGEAGASWWEIRPSSTASPSRRGIEAAAPAAINAQNTDDHRTCQWPAMALRMKAQPSWAPLPAGGRLVFFTCCCRRAERDLGGQQGRDIVTSVL